MRGLSFDLDDATDVQMSTEDETELRSRSRQPKDSKFKQQALPAWQPILTAGNVLEVNRHRSSAS